MRVRIVTDSASDIPPDLARDKAIVVVPLTVRFGDDTYVSGVDLDAKAFWAKLQSTNEPPATAAPSAGDFQTAYEKLVAEGATGIVSVHLSSKLSATYQSAVVAAKEITSIPVEVVDSLAVSASTGLLALHATDQAAGGASAADIAADVKSRSERVHLYGAIDTLEYLRRGGRIGGAQALLGTMLKVKPVISLDDGVVEPVGRVRTRAKALEHMVSLVREHKDRIERLVVLSGDAPDTDRLVELLADVAPVDPADVWTLGAIVGAHAGPGVIGVAYLTRPDGA
ncbi:MAG: DegV family protein [Actinomycetota bacterium]